MEIELLFDLYCALQGVLFVMLQSWAAGSWQLWGVIFVSKMTRQRRGVTLKRASKLEDTPFCVGIHTWCSGKLDKEGKNRLGAA